MSDTIKTTMLKAEKLAIKIKKKLKRSDLDSTTQVTINSTDPGQIYFALQITPVAEGLAPMTFINKDADQFIKDIEAQLENLDTTVIEKAYHQAQAAHAERTITFHNERIAEIDKELKEEQEDAK